NEGKAVVGFALDKETDVFAEPENGFASQNIFVSKKNCKEQFVANTNSSQSNTKVISLNQLISSNIKKNSDDLGKNLNSQINGTILGVKTKTKEDDHVKKIVYILLGLILLTLIVLNRKRVLLFIFTIFKNIKTTFLH
ncbi:MAG: hypothetical protein Q7R95_08835, partial [bacterium]|nr:hypothetical protein [bacterium]